MKIAAYQFAVTGSIKQNMKTIESAIEQAAAEGVELLIFPECALTGYPPHDIEHVTDICYDDVESCFERLQQMIDEKCIHIIVGAVTKEQKKYYNSAVLLAPGKEKCAYHKRVLWGFDKENFHAGNRAGVFQIAGHKIGVRICCEVRDSEQFLELKETQTELNVILFYDVTAVEDLDRYEMLRAQVRARASECGSYLLGVDAICPNQSAPTMLADAFGHVLAEAERNKEMMLRYNLEQIAG